MTARNVTGTRRDETRSLCLTSLIRVAMSSTTSDAVPHPSCCRSCRGTGWAQGEPITVQLDGRLHDVSTVRRCEHRWWWDDPTPDDEITLTEYRQRLNMRALSGDADAAAELTLWAKWAPKGALDPSGVLI